MYRSVGRLTAVSTIRWELFQIGITTSVYVCVCTDVITWVSFYNTRLCLIIASLFLSRMRPFVYDRVIIVSSDTIMKAIFIADY